MFVFIYLEYRSHFGSRKYSTISILSYSMTFSDLLYPRFLHRFGNLFCVFGTLFLNFVRNFRFFSQTSLPDESPTSLLFYPLSDQLFIQPFDYPPSPQILLRSVVACYCNNCAHCESPEPGFIFCCNCRQNNCRLCDEEN